jgi:hypothetical protein
MSIPVNEQRKATVTTVASSATSVTILAENKRRVGATIYNDSNQSLYLKFGATASSSDFTVAVAGPAYYEVPFGYNGRIDGVWASVHGHAHTTEIV